MTTRVSLISCPRWCQIFPFVARCFKLPIACSFNAHGNIYCILSTICWCRGDVAYAFKWETGERNCSCSKALTLWCKFGNRHLRSMWSQTTGWENKVLFASGQIDAFLSDGIWENVKMWYIFHKSINWLSFTSSACHFHVMSGFFSLSSPLNPQDFQTDGELEQTTNLHVYLTCKIIYIWKKLSCELPAVPSWSPRGLIGFLSKTYVLISIEPLLKTLS